MLYREKSAWVCLVTTLLIFFPYFGYVLQLFLDDQLSRAVVLDYFLGALFAQSMLTIVAHVVMSIRSRREKADERDANIEARSLRASYWVLTVMLWTLITCIPIPTVAGRVLTPLFISQLLLLAWVLGEVAKYTAQVVFYRRGY
jgi:hypothetical protein